MFGNCNHCCFYCGHPFTMLGVSLFISCKNKIQCGDFPGGPVVKNPPSNAGDVGSIPGWGTKIPRAAGQLSLCATTREKPACHVEPTHHNKDLMQPK